MQNRSNTRWLVTLAFGTVLMCSACGGHHAVVVGYASTPPPPLVVESVTGSPGSGYVWVQGYHTWNGSSYVWVPGRWVLPPHGRRGWAPGHWRHNGRGWYWVDGHWR